VVKPTRGEKYKERPGHLSDFEADAKGNEQLGDLQENREGGASVLPRELGEDRNYDPLRKTDRGRRVYNANWNYRCSCKGSLTLTTRVLQGEPCLDDQIPRVS